ncbi:MAG: homoserine kinase [Verrucomicrobiota bacterium]|nr:homoserine kinase [Verrucomicrobiota bacterium]
MLNSTTLVPATSANLGPGYDCLGVALQIYNRVTVTKENAPPPDSMNAEAARAFFERAKIPPFSFSWKIEGEVPRSRGLGSSVTVRLGILCGLCELCANPLTRDHLFELCAALEGHPDNAAPAAYGGFTICGPENSVARFEVSSQLKFVLLIPDFEIATADARKVLPEKISHRAATENTANACRITAAFASRNYEQLRGAFTDHLHQDYREPLIPFLKDVIRAGEKAGALGGYLSGSGSTIACVTLEKPNEVGEAMRAAAGSSGKIIITTADNTGATIGNRQSPIGNSPHAQVA